MSLYAIHLANGRTSNTGAMRLMGRLLSGPGVLEATGFAVTATTPTNDMSVKVSGSTTSDNLVIVTTTGDTYYGWNTAQSSVTIQSNSEGVIKTDALVAYIDTALTTTTPDNPGGLVLLTVRRGVGLTGAPTNTEIDTATGNKPWLKLAEITVGNGVSSINAGNIVDRRPFVSVSTAALPAVTTGANFTWFNGASSYSFSSPGATQIGTYSGSFTFSGGPFLAMMDVSRFTNAGGNLLFGLTIGSTNYVITPSTAYNNISLAGSLLFAAGTASGLQTVKPTGTAQGSQSCSVPAFEGITLSIIDWRK